MSMLRKVLGYKVAKAAVNAVVHHDSEPAEETPPSTEIVESDSHGMRRPGRLLTAGLVVGAAATWWALQRRRTISI